jgi:hypothetical protein
MKFKDRVKELVRLRPSEIVCNPSNWHEHPSEQIDFFIGLLAEVGFAGVCMVFLNEDGKYELVDGEMRTKYSSDDDSPIPCVVLDVTRDEAQKLLAFYDQIGQRGTINDIKLFDLLNTLDLGDASLTKNADLILLGLDIENGNQQPDEGTQVNRMDLLPHEHYDYVIVLARNTHDWNILHDLLKLKTVRYGKCKKQIGVGRAVDAGQVIKLLKDKPPIPGQAEPAPASSSSGDLLLDSQPPKLPPPPPRSNKGKRR